MTDELRVAIEADERAQEKARQAKQALHRAIARYATEHGHERGWQTEIVRRTGLTRERIRQIVDAERKKAPQ